MADNQVFKQARLKENAMKNREMLMELKNHEYFEKCLKDIAYEIIKSTFDHHVSYIDKIKLAGNKVGVQYWHRYYADFDYKISYVPIEWFDEGFDYAAAYAEMKRKEAEVQKRKEEAE